MQEGTLLKVAMVVALTGILVLLFINDKMSLEESNIKGVEDVKEDTSVKIKGRVVSVKETPGLYLIRVQDNTGAIGVVAFKQNNKEELHKGDLLEIEGKVKNYKGVNEIEAETIVLY